MNALSLTTRASARGSARWTWILVTLLLPVGAGLAPATACSDECVTGSYPAAPDGRDVVHVSAGCDAEGADGSAESPYATIQAAVDAAPDGAAVLVAPGSYAENLAISKPIMLVGSSVGSTADQAGIVVQAPEPYAIVVEANEVVIRGVRVAAPTSVGVWLKGGSLTLDDSVVEDAAADPEGKFGYGVLATDDGSIVVQRSTVSGAASVGIAIVAARAIVVQNVLKSCGSAGIRVEKATGEIQIEGNEILDNQKLGIGVFSSRAIVVQNTVRGTLSSDGDFGDGILVAPLKDDTTESDVTVDDNVVEGNARVGILYTGATRGIVVQNTISGNGVGTSRSAGVWLQAGAGGTLGIEVSGNTITANRLMGIGISSGARAIVVQNTAISQTEAIETFVGEVQAVIGDGIGVFSGGSAEVSGNTIGGNGRFGIAVDSADLTATTIDGNTISDNDQFGIVVQNQATPPSFGANDFSGNGAGSDDLEVVAAGGDTYAMSMDDIAVY